MRIKVIFGCMINWCWELMFIWVYNVWFSAIGFLESCFFVCWFIFFIWYIVFVFELVFILYGIMIICCKMKGGRSIYFFFFIFLWVYGFLVVNNLVVVLWLYLWNWGYMVVFFIIVFLFLVMMYISFYILLK